MDFEIYGLEANSSVVKLFVVIRDVPEVKYLIQKGILLNNSLEKNFGRHNHYVIINV